MTDGENSNLNPPRLKTEKYKAWRRDVMVWEDLTNLKHEKKGLALFLSLPEEAKDQIRELVSHEKLKETTTTGTGPTAVTSSKGFKTVLEELDKLYAKDEVVSLYEKFEKYKSCKRKKGQTVSEFLKEFDLVCMQMDTNEEMKIPDAFKAIELLHKSNLPEEPYYVRCYEEKTERSIL